MFLKIYFLVLVLVGCPNVRNNFRRRFSEEAVQKEGSSRCDRSSRSSKEKALEILGQRGKLPVACLV